MACFCFPIPLMSHCHTFDLNTQTFSTDTHSTHPLIQHISLPHFTYLMEASPSLEISLTAPQGSADQFALAQPPNGSTGPPLTVQCERGQCKKTLSQTLARKVMVRGPNATSKEMVVCAECYIYYQNKSSTTNRK